MTSIVSTTVVLGCTRVKQSLLIIRHAAGVTRKRTEVFFSEIGAPRSRRVDRETKGRLLFEQGSGLLLANFASGQRDDP